MLMVRKFRSTKQHQGDVMNKKPLNGIYDHLKTNKRQKINWEKVRYLDKENNWKGRQRKDAIYINSLYLSTRIDPCKLMILEKGSEFHLIWSKFNPLFRDLVR